MELNFGFSFFNFIHKKHKVFLGYEFVEYAYACTLDSPGSLGSPGGPSNLDSSAVLVP